MANIVEKPNGTFLIRVSKGLDSFGKQIVKSRVFKPSKPNLSHAKLQRELDAFVKNFENEISREEGHKTAEEITFAKFIPEYLRIKKSVLAPTTFAFYQRIIETELIPKFGDLYLSEIKTRHVQEFIQYLYAEMPRKDCPGGHIKSTTVKRYTSVLRSILTLAYVLYCLALILRALTKSKKEI